VHLKVIGRDFAFRTKIDYILSITFDMYILTVFVCVDYWLKFIAYSSIRTWPLPSRAFPVHELSRNFSVYSWDTESYNINHQEISIVALWAELQCILSVVDMTVAYSFTFGNVVWFVH
jgi:hypothetical protein